MKNEANNRSDRKEEILRAEAGEARFTPTEASASEDAYEFDLGDNFTPNKIVIDFAQISTRVWNPEVPNNN